MARDFDAQLLESVKVRRRRLRDAFLRGALASRRPTVNNVRSLVASTVLAGVICAGCAATSFVHKHLHDTTSLPAPVTVRVTETPPATTVGGF